MAANAVNQLPPGFQLDAAPASPPAQQQLPPGFQLDAPAQGTPQAAPQPANPGGPTQSPMDVLRKEVMKDVTPQGSAPAQKPGSLQTLDDTMRMLASGATFGYADEISAGMNAILGIGNGNSVSERYNNNLQGEMSRDAAIRQREPGASTAAEFMGGLGTGIPGAGWLMKAKYLAKLPAWIRTALVGSVGGALAGSGNAGPGHRTEGAAVGGVLGAGMGAGLGLTKAAATTVIRHIVSKGSTPAIRQGAAKVIQALTRDELTPDQAMQRMHALGHEARLVDVGDNTRSLGRAVAGQPGKAKNIATGMLDTRQEGQGSRVVAAVNEALDPSGNFVKAAEDLQAARKTAAAPLYDAAYAKPITPTESLISLFRRPAMRQAWVRAQKIAQNEGDVLPDNLYMKRPDGGEIVNPDAIRSVKVLDYIKRGLDDTLDPQRDPITRKIRTNAGRAIDSLRREYTSILDKMSPDYAKARAAWSGPSRSLEMMDMGRNFVRLDEEITAKQIANMTPDERLFFRMGAARQLRDTIHNAPDGADAVKRIFGSELKRARLRQVFPNQESFNKFRGTMMKEAEMYKTRAMVSPHSGSQTALRQAEASDLASNVGSGVAQLAKGNAGGAVHRFLRGLLGPKAEKLDPAQAEAIAKMLFTNDPEVNRQIIRALSFQRILDKIDVGTGVAAMAGGRQAGEAAVTQSR